MKRLLFWTFLLLLLGVPAALAALAWLALDDQPRVVRSLTLTPQSIERAKSIVRAQDPRRHGGALRTVSLRADDIELAANYVLSQHGGAAKVVLLPGFIQFWLTLPVPANPFGAYVNVEGALQQTSALPRVDALRVGRAPVPGMVADWIVAQALERLRAMGGADATEGVQALRVEANQLHVEYRLHEATVQRLRSLLAADEALLSAYQRRLADLAAELPQPAPLPLLLGPLLALAAERSTGGGDPVAENRAALFVAAFYVNGRGLTALVPQARSWPRPPARKVTLAGRHDLAQHFTVSAAIAAAAGSPLADAIGLQKEVADAQGGSGFSFADLAADRAGTIFGTHAARSAQSARSLQQRIARGAEELHFMPSVEGLPEPMSEVEFKRRYGGVGEPEYRRVQAEIERRIAALALYR